MAAMAAAAVLAACGSIPGIGIGGGRGSDPVSDFIMEARMRAPENAILGIGSSTHSNRSLARATAETRARAEITRALDSMVNNMITDYTAGSEAEQRALLQFSETITQALARSQLRGAIIHDEISINGEQIVIVLLSAQNSINEIMSANASAAALAPHMANAQWALERMENAFEQHNMAPPVVRDRD